MCAVAEMAYSAEFWLVLRSSWPERARLSCPIPLAPVAAAYGPWFITPALGPRYDEAADLFRWLCWAFTPFAIAVLLCQCFNVIDGRGKAATIMAGMTVMHAGLLAHYVDQSPAAATIGSLLVAAAGGMIVALHQIEQKLGLRGHLWWVKFIIVIAAAYAVFEGGWAPLMITAPAALAVGAVLTWLLRIFDADDIAAVRGLLSRADFQP